MNSSAPHPHRRRLTRAEVRRRRRNRAIRRVAGLTVMLCVAVGGVSFLLTRHAVVPSASAASAISMPAQSIADSTVSSAENTAAPANALGLTADEARAMLADPLMVLVNHTHKLADGYTITTKKCGSSTAINKDLQTEAADAFFAMQAAAATFKNSYSANLPDGAYRVDIPSIKTYSPSSSAGHVIRCPNLSPATMIVATAARRSSMVMPLLQPCSIRQVTKK